MQSKRNVRKLLKRQLKHTKFTLCGDHKIFVHVLIHTELVVSERLRPWRPNLTQLNQHESGAISMTVNLADLA